MNKKHDKKRNDCNSAEDFTRFIEAFSRYIVLQRANLDTLLAELKEMGDITASGDGNAPPGGGG